jgi:exonuclease VII small subunit
MKTKNILDNSISKSIKETKKEISYILEKLENKDTNLSESIDDYQRLVLLNKRIYTFFKARNKEVSLIGKKKKNV